MVTIYTPHLDSDKPFSYRSNQELIDKWVHTALLQAGYGTVDQETPLSDVIKIGNSVLIKPNWVLNYNQSNHGMECMITQPELVLAVAKEIVKTKPGKIIIGDSPIQGCFFSKEISDQFLRSLQEISKNIDVTLIDFRRIKMKSEDLMDGIEENARSLDHYVLFDLGKDSLLEEISKPRGRFRVTMYDPRDLNKTHHPGKHEYLLCKEVFESDVVINMPKLKTHRKACMTGALKNLVGINGNKNYLPHHRKGSVLFGGDCYSGFWPLKILAEYYLDNANKNIGKPEYQRWYGLFSRALQMQSRFGDIGIEGSWYGNDTIWRTVLDINRIALFGRSDGSMAEDPQRVILSITDGIVAGQGEGPLAPDPLNLGMISVATNSVIADTAHAVLLGLDPEKIPVIRHGYSQMRWPLTDVHNWEEIKVRYNDQVLTINQLVQEKRIQCRPPKGWAGHCEWNE